MVAIKEEGFVWKCECGYIHYGKNPPKECQKCNETSLFEQVPEDLVDQTEEEFLLNQLPGGAEGDDDEI